MFRNALSSHLFQFISIFYNPFSDLLPNSDFFRFIPIYSDLFRFIPIFPIYSDFFSIYIKSLFHYLDTIEFHTFLAELERDDGYLLKIRDSCEILFPLPTSLLYLKNISFHFFDFTLVKKKEK